MRKFTIGLFVVWASISPSACRNKTKFTAGSDKTQILLFNGTGTSANDVSAIRDILVENHLGFTVCGSSELNALSEQQLASYRLLIIPGGNFVDMGNSLTPFTTALVRSAVKNGLNYLGICAGAFLAGNSPYNGINLTAGVRFQFYSAENSGIRKAAVAVTDAGGHTLDQYWEDGPQLSGWGQIVAKYPDGTPAVVQGMVGKGQVVLSGIHAEAPEKWRNGMNFRTSAKEDDAWSGLLIMAALRGTPLSHF